MHAPLALLIADHRGAGLAEHLAGLSADGVRIERAENLASSRSWLTRQAFQVVLLDPLARRGASELQDLRAAAMAPPALPAPSTRVRPLRGPVLSGGAGRKAAVLCAGRARCTAAS